MCVGLNTSLGETLMISTVLYLITVVDSSRGTQGRVNVQKREGTVVVGPRTKRSTKMADTSVGISYIK